MTHIIIIILSLTTVLTRVYGNIPADDQVECPLEYRTLLSTSASNHMVIEEYSAGFLTNPYEVLAFQHSYQSRLDQASSEFSTSSYLNLAQDSCEPMLYRLARLVSACVGKSLAHLEPFAFTKYRVGQSYGWHVDSYDPRRPRYATAIFYLNTVTRGGETVFLHLPAKRTTGTNTTRVLVESKSSPRPLVSESCARNSDRLTIQPVFGKVVIFYNLVPGTRDVNPSSLHGACPTDSFKSILQLWIDHDALDYPHFISPTTELRNPGHQLNTQPLNPPHPHPHHPHPHQ